jgi:hypothetical protein
VGGASEPDELADSSVGPANVENPTRSVNLPLRAFLDLAQSPIDFNSSNSVFSPDFAFFNSGLVIIYDDDGGAEDFFGIASTLSVPPDYASGGSFALRISKDAHQGSSEFISCQAGINGAPPGGAGGSPEINTAAIAVYVVAPSGAYAPGDSVAVSCFPFSAPGSIDDVIRIHSIEFRYTATQ